MYSLTRARPHRPRAAHTRDHRPISLRGRSPAVNQATRRETLRPSLQTVLSSFPVGSILKGRQTQGGIILNARVAPDHFPTRLDAAGVVLPRERRERGVASFPSYRWVAMSWTDLWSQVMTVEKYGKWGYGVVQLMEAELGDQ